MADPDIDLYLSNAAGRGLERRTLQLSPSAVPGLGLPETHRVAVTIVIRNEAGEHVGGGMRLYCPPDCPDGECAYQRAVLGGKWRGYWPDMLGVYDVEQDGDGRPGFTWVKELAATGEAW